MKSFVFDASVRGFRAAEPQTVKRNSDLIWTWDFMSLAICLDWAPTTVRSVPTTTEPTDLELTATDGNILALAPWPFRTETATLRAEGRRLDGAYESEQALQAGLMQAPWETAHFELRKA